MMQQGGCIKTDSTILTLESSTLLNNFALTGGVVYQNYSSISLSNLNESNILSNNYAFLYGNNVSSQPWGIHVGSQNQTKINSLFREYQSVSLTLLNTTFQHSHYMLSNFSSFFALNNLLSIYLIDNFTQNITFNSFFPLEIDILYPSTNQTVHLIDPTLNITPSSQFKFLASNITLPPILQNESIQILASYDGFQLSLTLDISMRGCLEGEEYEPLTGSCLLCPAHFYSLEVNKSCAPCPSGAFCPGGKFIKAHVGFWREPGSSLVYSCLNDSVSRCAGGYETSDQCVLGYSGALCQGCNYTAGYSPSSAFVCNECGNSLGWLILVNLFAILMTFAYELFMIFLTYRSNKVYVRLKYSKDLDLPGNEIADQKIRLSSEMAILNHFFQLAFIISNYIFDIETTFATVLDEFLILLSFVSIQTQNVSSFDCMLLQLGVKPSQVTYVKMIFQICLPICKMILLVSVITIRHFFKRKFRNIWSKISLFIITLISLEQIGILTNLTKFNLCRIGPLKNYSLIDPNLDCSDPAYISFTRSFIYPNLVFWGAVIPIFMAVIFVKIRNRIHEENIRKTFGSFMNIFKEDMYYFNLVIMALRIGMLVILTTVETPRIATLALLILFGLYIVFVVKKKPLIEVKLNYANEVGMLGIFVSLFLFNQAVGNPSDFIIASGVIIGVIYLGFPVYISTKIFHSLRKRLRDYLEERRKKKIEELEGEKDDEEEQNEKENNESNRKSLLGAINDN